MAIVLSCADKTRIVIKCDGREVSEHGAILSEDHVWYTIISPACIIGHMGDSMVCEMIMIALKQKISSKENLTMEEIAKELQTILQATTDTTHGCSFLLAGIDATGTHLFGMAYQDGFREILDKSPKDEDVVCENLVAGPASLASAQSFAQMYDYKKSMESNMNGYIRYIGSMDDSVNDRITTEKIRFSK